MVVGPRGEGVVVPSTLDAIGGLGDGAVAVVEPIPGNPLAAPLDSQFAVGTGGFAWVLGSTLLLVWEAGKPRGSEQQDSGSNELGVVGSSCLLIVTFPFPLQYHRSHYAMRAIGGLFVTPPLCLPTPVEMTSVPTGSLCVMSGNTFIFSPPQPVWQLRMTENGFSQVCFQS